MKRLFLILMSLCMLLVSAVANAQSIEGFGEAPIDTTIPFCEAKAVARQAAIVDVKRQTHGNPFRIIREAFLEGGIYIIQAEF